jgi:hypothetical protein
MSQSTALALDNPELSYVESTLSVAQTRKIGLFLVDTDVGDEIDVTPEEVHAKLDTHEAVCAERYDGIKGRLKRLEGVLVTSAGAIIMLLIGIVLELSKG